MSDWHRIGTITDIPRRGARCVLTPLGRIAIFRTAEDHVFATEDRCPHKGGPLSQGIVHDASVTCPLHNQVISLKTGRVEGPDEGAVRTFAIRVDPLTETIEISLDAAGAQPFAQAAE
ncbi:nitrite reductase small subunit NirD [Aurantimonas sp. VKM B-3413]|uniref:nitrite reductase small subunit NirD n=1 Tax=Aurantimonas sp. VKM B-3413 TaxID=2779401 RepID=UPI001E64A617|nr:nitrite reductase small subunit NirD [Aurantimonas sp. VKM B-3413]MCB8838887.1 nitrite reductase small subunit NirD [Aurantimonas sp. VKM B-3413]